MDKTYTVTKGYRTPTTDMDLDWALSKLPVGAGVEWKLCVQADRSATLIMLSDGHVEKTWDFIDVKFFIKQQERVYR